MATSITLSTGRQIGVGFPSYCIAEIGSNHDGYLDRAKRLIELAKESGADAAKFQSFHPSTLVNQKAKKDNLWIDHPSWETLERLSIPLEWHAELTAHADKVGIDFLSTPFDSERLHSLLSVNVPAIKIASGDMTYHSFLREVGASGKPVFLSTGMSDQYEVEKAIEVLKQSGCKQIVLLHCTSLYPPGFSEINLSVLSTFQETFYLPVGISDHTLGSVVPLGAVALGACVVEKHFTDDPTRSGPDHPFAMSPDGFARMVSQIRDLEAAFGQYHKYPTSREKQEQVVGRRAIYSKIDIPADTVLTEEYIHCVRHAYPEGIQAPEFEQTLGKIAKVAIPAHSLITPEMI